MGILSKLFSVGDASSTVEAVGKGLDALFTSDEERLDKQAILTRLAQKPAAMQVELNKVEAGHRSLFVAGWRPFLGWVCGIGLGFTFVANPVLQWLTGDVGPEVPADVMMELVIAMLGLGGLRTFEKVKGKAK